MESKSNRLPQAAAVARNAEGIIQKVDRGKFAFGELMQLANMQLVGQKA